MRQHINICRIITSTTRKPGQEKNCSIFRCKIRQLIKFKFNGWTVSSWFSMPWTLFTLREFESFYIRQILVCWRMCFLNEKKTLLMPLLAQMVFAKFYPRVLFKDTLRWFPSKCSTQSCLLLTQQADKSLFRKSFKLGTLILFLDADL